MEYILGFEGSYVCWRSWFKKTKKEAGDYTEDYVNGELSQLCAQVYLYKGYICRIAGKYQLENVIHLPMEHDFRNGRGFCAPCLLFSRDGFDKKFWEWLQLIGI